LITDFRLPKAIADFIIGVKRVLATMINDTFLAKAAFSASASSFSSWFNFPVLIRAQYGLFVPNKNRQAHEKITNYYFGCNICAYHASLQ
jgi:hypothetical protein